MTHHLPKLGARDYLALNAYWFAISFLWNGMSPLLLSALILRVVDESRKGAALGFLSIVGLFIAIIVQPLAGAWTDARTTRWGKRRPYLVGGTLFDGVFLLALFYARDYLSLVIAYVLLQIASNIAHGPYQAYLTDLVPESQRGQVSGVKLVFEMLGFVATAFVVGQLLERAQLFAAFLAIIGVLLGALVITVRGVDEGACVVDARPRGAGRADTALWRIVVHSRDFFWWLVSRWLILGAVNLIRNYLVFFLRDVLHIENAAAESGALLMILGIAVTLVAYPASAASDRWGRKPLIIGAGILGAVGAVALIFSTTLSALLIVGLCIGISTGIFLSVNWAWGADLIPRAAGGRFLGISNLATAGAGIIGGAGGWLLDALPAPMGYHALYLSAALCYAIGTLIVLGVREARSESAAAGPSPEK